MCKFSVKFLYKYKYVYSVCGYVKWVMCELYHDSVQSCHRERTKSKADKYCADA